MKEHAVMGAASAAVRMNLTPLAAGSDELMNLKTSIAKSDKPTAARDTELTREIDKACSNPPDCNSVVSLELRPASRNMVRQCGSESHNHLPPIPYGLVVFA